MAFKIIGGNYCPTFDPITPTMEPGVYVIDEDYRLSCCLAKPVSEGFNLPKKLYGLDNSFVNRVITAACNTSANTGILLHGYQGTGKTVTGKVIANKMDVPVLLYQRRYTQEKFIDFLNAFNQPFVIFIDEYEKVFANSPNQLLAMMDGAFSSKSKFTLIATANQPVISEYMHNRPSRLRYIKGFDFLDVATVEEIAGDLLVKKDLKQAVVDFLVAKPSLTIDVVCSFVEEVNIQTALSIEECGVYFNFAKNNKVAVAIPEELAIDYSDNGSDD